MRCGVLCHFRNQFICIAIVRNQHFRQNFCRVSIFGKGQLRIMRMVQAQGKVQITTHIRHVRITIRQFFSCCLNHNIFQSLWHIFILINNARQVFLKMLEGNGNSTIAIERNRPCQHLINDNPYRIEITLRCCIPATRLLRAEVMDGTKH